MFIYNATYENVETNEVIEKKISFKDDSMTRTECWKLAIEIAMSMEEEDEVFMSIKFVV